MIVPNPALLPGSQVVGSLVSLAVKPPVAALDSDAAAVVNSNSSQDQLSDLFVV